MILVIILLSSFLLGLWLFARPKATRPTRPTLFLADFHSGSYREIDPVTYLEIATGRQSGSRSNGARLRRFSDAYPGLYPGSYREMDPAFHPHGDFAHPKLVTYVACTECWLVSYTLGARCHHRYCPECLTILFENATKDESMYPPRCCDQVMPLASVRSIISSKLADICAEKAKEYETIDRTYCVNPACGKFIQPESMRDNHDGCHMCGTSACSRCKKEYHVEHCLLDDDTEKLLKLVKRKKWQTCSSCHRLVERRGGCSHMRCICGHDFCYRCGEPLRLCRC